MVVLLAAAPHAQLPPAGGAGVRVRSAQQHGSQRRPQARSLCAAAAASPHALAAVAPSALRRGGCGTTHLCALRRRRSVGASLHAPRCSAGAAAGDAAGAGGSGGGVLQRQRASLARSVSKIREYGLAGVLSYGLLNTAYYSVAFGVVWSTIQHAPRGVGATAAAREVATVLAVVWLGSQATKALRAAAALLLAPLSDALLLRLAPRTPGGTKAQAFWLVVAACLLVAAAVFGAAALTVA